MDLNQRKLTKSEWQGIEVPVSSDEKEILELIIRGAHDVNTKYNKHNSLQGFLKIEHTAIMEDYLYNKYFSSSVTKLRALYPIPELVINVQANPAIKKADLIRLEKNTAEKIKFENAIEYLYLDLIKNILKQHGAGDSRWVNLYFTLYKLVI